MNLTNSILKFDEGCNSFLINHRFSWCLILAAAGMVLGLSGIYAIGVQPKQGFLMGTGYSLLLLLIELTAGGRK